MSPFSRLGFEGSVRLAVAKPSPSPCMPAPPPPPSPPPLPSTLLLPQPMIGSADQKKSDALQQKSSEASEESGSSGISTAESSPETSPASLSRSLRDRFCGEYCKRAAQAAGTSTPGLQPWVAALLDDPLHGGGAVGNVSPTVILSKHLVLKATTRLESELMEQLGKVCRQGVVPQLVASFDAAEVYCDVPQGCDTAVLYRKCEGTVASDLLASLARRYVVSRDPTLLKQMTETVALARDAAEELYTTGVVHQDLWTGNVVIDESTNEVSFLDVVDCAMAGPEAFQASVGGLVVSSLGLVLGIIVSGSPSSFSPKQLWENRPAPWWLHTHWSPTVTCPPPSTVSACTAVADALLSLPGLEEVVKVAVVTHLERFVGSRSGAGADLLRKHLPSTSPYIRKSVKQAALACGMMSSAALASCMQDVRGPGFWVLMRQELGRALADELKSAVLRRLQPVEPNGFGMPCPLVAAPQMPPCAALPPFQTHSVPHAPCPAVAPLPSSSSSLSADSDAVANLLTVEQMMLCGELSQEATSVLGKWSVLYGLGFQSLDDVIGM